MPGKKRSPMGRSPSRAKTERDELGRLRSALTEPLLKQLCETHEAGDFRNITAARCGVHPKMLSRWLKQGAASEGKDLYARLFVEFMAIEGTIRAECVKELRDTQASFEETVFDEGKPTGKTVTTRRTSGIQWYLERRFHQWRNDWVRREDEGDVVDILQPAATAFTMEAAVAIVTQLAENMPPALRAIFAAKGWQQMSEANHGA